ncbi:DUF1822 family protein [Calothrix sp. UHCC 0171]|uniref:DUF1822 family protein n=1 Tax=Calothrix sp. UHCC 0171 TaxID=3110245 RepID=UPI002B1F5769|nr:DUF1822 family protein [Calothrix sp. UHCC 0171]MEA5574021.1 DUF1822 family protein [Calothrix sp. UHCC 0171]
MSLEFERLPTESLSLETEEIEKAIALSSQIPDESRQWQTYLNALGLFTFTKWLEERDNHLTVNWQESTIAKPELANVFPVVTNLQVGQFKICLITLESLFDEQVSLPRLVIELSEFIPHFYVLIEILEEQESGIVRGVMNYQQLRDNLTSLSSLDIQADWTYKIPLNWFEKDPNNLLLYLRAVESEAIPLPALMENRQQQLAAIENELVRLLPQLQTSEIELWQVLNWQQGSVILNFPELLEWIYKLQNNNLEIANLASEKTYLLDLIKLITQPALNLGRWLWDELDEIGESLSWQLLNLTPAREFRSPVEEFAVIKSQLQTQGVEIPTVARCGHHNFNLAGNPLRIYAVAWNSSTENDPNMWSLVLILGTPAPNTLPHNLQFRLSDRTGILTEQQVNPQQLNSYLFTAVAGNWDEKFIASVSIANGVEVTLSPFAFDIRQAG